MKCDCGKEITYKDVLKADGFLCEDCLIKSIP